MKHKIISRKALVLLLAPLLPGCASTIEALLGIRPPTLYANWKSRGVHWTDQSASRVFRAPGGQEITVTTLSDGQEALEIRCNEVGLQTIVSNPYLTRKEKQQVQINGLRWMLQQSHAECIEEAAKQCRLFLWNGKATFALMDEWSDFPLDEDVIRKRLYTRCMTLDALKEWAISSSAPIDAMAEEPWNRLLDESGE